MIKKQSRKQARKSRHYGIRNRVHGTTVKPRLSVFRSNKHIYAQIIDDVNGLTLVASSTVDKGIRDTIEKSWNVEAAKIVGEDIGRKAVEKGIEEVVFDRGGHLYHGKVAALADGAREAGLKF